MAAQTAKRAVKRYKAKYVELAATTQQVYQGGIACFDTSTGLVAKAVPSTTMIPIGTFTEDKNVAAGGTVVVELFRELDAVWFKNDATVVAATVGGLCYLLDDQTVSNTDNTNTRSVAGRVWKISATDGVLVEPIYDAHTRLGGLDA
jgi:hypothetical protein